MFSQAPYWHGFVAFVLLAGDLFQPTVDLVVADPSRRPDFVFVFPPQMESPNSNAWAGSPSVALYVSNSAIPNCSALVFPDVDVAFRSTWCTVEVPFLHQERLLQL